MNIRGEFSAFPAFPAFSIFPVIVLALVMTIGFFWLPVGAEDMDSILQNHDPRGDSSDAASVSKNSPAPAGIVVRTSSASPVTTNVKEIDELLKTLEELVKILETLTDRLAPESAKTSGKSSGKAGRYPTTGTVRVNSSLNIRTSPWGKIIGSFHEGDQIKILGREGDWYKISWNGSTVWSHANYVDAPGAPAGQTPVKEPGSSASAGNPNPTGPPQPPSSGNGRFGAMPSQPMPSRASSEFGPRKLFGSFHYGIDLPVPTGTRINALGDGVVSGIGYDPGGGNFVKIRYDNGLESVYYHLKSYSVRSGQRVSMSQEVARSDNTGKYTTGAHLHMGIKRNGSYINPRTVMKLP